MPKDAYIRTRIDSFLKEQAELVFSRLGLNMTEAISMFLVQVTLRNGLPFEITIPDTDTAFHEAKEAAYRERVARLNSDIEEGAKAIREGRYLTPEESRVRVNARIEAWKSGRKPD